MSYKPKAPCPHAYANLGDIWCRRADRWYLYLLLLPWGKKTANFTKLWTLGLLYPFPWLTRIKFGMRL